MKREAAHCANMMDCHIWSVAHNATITGPKCRVCAAFTIEMRRSVGIENLVISFPPRAEGKRFSWAGGRQVYPRRAVKTQTSNSFVFNTNLQMAFQRRTASQHSGERFLCRCLRFWFICLLLTMGETGERGTRVTSDSPLETRWREDGSSARQQHCSTLPCPKLSASVVLIVRHPLALFR